LAGALERPLNAADRADDPNLSGGAGGTPPQDHPLSGVSVSGLDGARYCGAPIHGAHACHSVSHLRALPGEPCQGVVETVLRRLLPQLAKRWPEGAPPWVEDEHQRLQALAVQERLPLGEEPRRRLVAVLEGFSLHAGTWVHGNDRHGPNAKLRPLVVRPSTVEGITPTPSPSPRPPPATAKPTPPRLDWATLQARTFGEDVWRWPCGGRRRVLAVVSCRSTAEEVLQRLGLLQPHPSMASGHGPAPPPQLSLAL